jgi:hypothetical protein
MAEVAEIFREKIDIPGSTPRIAPRHLFLCSDQPGPHRAMSLFTDKEIIMSTDNKKVTQEAGRWLRVGMLTLTTLGPIVNVVAARLRERAAAQRAQTMKQAQSLRGELAERGGKLSQAVVERGSQLTHDLAERGSKATLLLMERGSEMTRDLAQQGGKVSQQLMKRGSQASREIGKRSRKAARTTTRELTGRRGTRWTLLGFAIGLLVAGAAAYLFMQKRMRRLSLEEEDEHIELAHNGHRESAGRTAERGHPVDQHELAPVTAAPAPEVETAAVAVAAQPAAQEAHATPANAAFLGIVSTRHYYPVETPLDQLIAPGSKPQEIIYFGSEEEAKSQGFSPVES